MLVPRLIHQTLPDKTVIPAAIASNIAHLRANNPGWIHIIHDDNDIQRFILDHYGLGVLTTFNSINPLYGAARADLFRYLLMYEHGGVYLDAKSGSRHPLDHVIADDDSLLLSYWNNGQGQSFHGWGVHPEDGVASELQNWHIICAPHHPILGAVINEVIENIRGYKMRKFGVGRRGVLRTTGPIAYTKAIMPLLEQHDHRFFDSEECGLIYSTMPLGGNTPDHTSLFRNHYSRHKKPLVSQGPQTPLDNLRHSLLKRLGQLP